LASFLAGSILVPVALLNEAVAGAGPAPLSDPAYSLQFFDCVTGNNQFETSDDDLHHWYVNQLAGSDGATGDIKCDSWQNDQYERPTDQTFGNRTIGSKPTSPPADFSGLLADTELDVGEEAYSTDSGLYFEYLDITRANAGFDDDRLYFRIELFGVDQVDSNGNQVDKFGEGTYYTVRLGTDANPDKANNGIALRNQWEKDIPTTWSADSSKVKIFRDTNGDASGTGGRNFTKEDGDVIGSNDGFDLDVANDEWLWVRRVSVPFTGPGGTVNRPAIEFAFDYKGYNAANPGADFTPESVKYMEFDATRGLKDNQNYLWNDEYTLEEAGSPNPGELPAISGTVNIYQLDTLRGAGFPCCDSSSSSSSSSVSSSSESSSSESSSSVSSSSESSSSESSSSVSSSSESSSSVLSSSESTSSESSSSEPSVSESSESRSEDSTLNGSIAGVQVPAALPRTGIDPGLLLMLGGMLVITGVLIMRYSYEQV
jgi:hypothetical protein